MLFYLDEFRYAYGFLVPILLASLIGLILIRVVKVKEETILTFQESSAVVILAWLVTILVNSSPFMLLTSASFTQSVFESVSGITTTGLSVFIPETLPQSVLLHRSLLQLIGGVGIVAIMISAIIGPQGMGLSQAEGRGDRLIPNIISSIKLVLGIYFALWISLVILYLLFGMSWFDAINYAMTVISTGGFSTHSAGLRLYNSVQIEILTIVFMIMGSINFSALYLLFTRKFKSFASIGEHRFMLIFLILGTTISSMFMLQQGYTSLPEELRVLIFENVSAYSTTGLSLSDSYTSWHPISMFILIVFMTIGGGYGSTSGGIKSFRVYLLLKSILWEFKAYFQPKNVIREEYVVKPEGRYFVDRQYIQAVSNFVFIYLSFIVILTLFFLSYNYSIETSLFQAATALSGVGHSIIDYTQVGPFLLWITMFGMFIGRLEIVIFFIGVTKILRDSKYFIDTE